MRRTQRILMLAVIAAILPMLAGCADFDPDKLDIFGLNEKKKLPGDRKPLFPEGVPGVSQGIPPEFMKGNQPPQDAAQTTPAEPDSKAASGPAKKTAAVEPAGEPKAKPKRKAKAQAKPSATAAAPASQSQPAASDQQQAPPPWPTAPASGN
jgi:hypothetical protein